jgi:hypothetical protein
MMSTKRSTMPINPIISDIKVAIQKKNFPTIVMWNRLEGSPRTHDFDRALKAEVRDAIWMLTKQWQMGEFKADDAGSPVFAKVHLKTSELNRFRASDQVEKEFDEEMPLEVRAEQQYIPFQRGGRTMSLDLRMQIGSYWMKLLRKNNLNYPAEYIRLYRFDLPAQSRDRAEIYAHKGVWQQYSAMSRRAMDGYLLLDHIQSGGKASDGVVLLNPGDAVLLDGLGDKLVSWYLTLFTQPAGTDELSWIPPRLEYSFETSSISGESAKKLVAESYHGGRPDWYAFDISEKQIEDSGIDPANYTDSFIPARVAFDGMPNTRWWKFEDGKTDLGDVKPDTTDLAKLLLVEFGLVYANDWFLTPFVLPKGSLAEIKGLMVTNNFGENTWITASERPGNALDAWSMYKMHSPAQDNHILLAPVAPKVHDGQPLEEIVFIRDEMANMVWGIETKVPTILGRSEKGSELALQTRAFHQGIVEKNKKPPAVPYAAPIAYLAMTDVPENWIPFVPVHKKNDNRETQLQRASMLRIIEGDDPNLKPDKVKPMTTLLREGLENKPAPLPYYVHEEEVPRAGVCVKKQFRRTRWLNGSVFTWLAIRRNTGRGEGSSGLGFDMIVESPKEKK